MRFYTCTVWRGLIFVLAITVLASKVQGESAPPEGRAQAQADQRELVEGARRALEMRILLSYLLENIEQTLTNEPPQTEADDLWKQIGGLVHGLQAGSIASVMSPNPGEPLKFGNKKTEKGMVPVLVLPPDFALAYLNDPLFEEAELVHQLKHLSAGLSEKKEWMRWARYEEDEDVENTEKKRRVPFAFRFNPDKAGEGLPEEVPLEEREACVAEAVYSAVRAKTQEPVTFEYQKMIEAYSSKGGQFGQAWNDFISFRTGVDQKFREELRQQVKELRTDVKSDALELELHDALSSFADELMADIEKIRGAGKTRLHAETQQAYEVALSVNRLINFRLFLKDTFSELKSKGIINRDYDSIEASRDDYQKVFGSITEMNRKLSFNSGFRKAVAFRSRPLGDRLTALGLVNRKKFIQWQKDKAREAKEQKKKTLEEEKEKQQKNPLDVFAWHRAGSSIFGS